MPPVAPLPFWPINGIEFDPALHLERVLSVFGCSTSCSFFSTEQDRAYASTVFSNVRDPHTGLQRFHCFPEARPIFTRMDDWLHRDHDHPVDSDLVFQHPRYYSFPSLFTRPILVAGISETDGGFVDDALYTVARIHVADIHLRWSEISRGALDASYSPSRYPRGAYPFDHSYFRGVCSQFRPLPSASPSNLPLRHSATGLPVAQGSYRALMQLIVDFDLDHPPEHPSDPEWYLMRVPTATYIDQLLSYSGFWWPDLDAIVRRLRLLAVATWLDEQRRLYAHSPSELRRAILGSGVALSDWQHDADDDGWGWLMAGF
ncbi:hypothetical protein GSI_06872 [Ganoderma sinense ZZ0214-1]|uniref:Uncharacterized protein n=1 Tax=Ganoderma sinense ZZ0214-1 TaxID=1077348 RepID=A0A2G8SAC7_9APHY|nr:hypothetical protein GSI_06872 [Ganoderma sinense ZZ0214-1]